MELPEIKKVQMQDLDRWFTTLVDSVNYDFQEVSKLVLGLQDNLATIDTAPIQYLKNALDGLVDSLNNSFSAIKNELESMDRRLKSLEGA